MTRLSCRVSQSIELPFESRSSNSTPAQLIADAVSSEGVKCSALNTEPNTSAIPTSSERVGCKQGGDHPCANPIPLCGRGVLDTARRVASFSASRGPLSWVRLIRCALRRFAIQFRVTAIRILMRMPLLSAAGFLG